MNNRILDSTDALEEYRLFWKCHPLIWRISNVVRWRFGALLSALFGMVSPGERFLLEAHKAEREELQKQIAEYQNAVRWYEEILDQHAKQFSPIWEHDSEFDDEPTNPRIRIPITVTDPEKE